MSNNEAATIFIGLEIHVQLNSPEKLFCTCSTLFGDRPNSNVCPVCLGYPGVLPSLNHSAMRKAYIVARALNCRLTRKTSFARKNYFYPDLPKNYQISQFAAPLGTEGSILLDRQADDEPRVIGINEVHLEEDAGKMIHSGDVSLLDFNRTGTPLLEIVTKPDLRGAKEAELLLQQMRQIVRYLGVSDGNMEEGSLRCDANISLALASDASVLPPYKVEIKNMNSSRFVRLALEYEISRQRELLQQGNTPTQETRLWNENRDITVAMRSKEDSMDYRYFPEPDLPLFIATDDFLSQVEAELVELPPERVERMAKQYQITTEQARALCVDKATADYFEACVAAGGKPIMVHSWLFADIRKQLNKHNLSIESNPVTPEQLAELLSLLDVGTIHGKIAKQLLEVMITERRGAKEIIDERGWKSIGGDELQRLVEQVIASNPETAKSIQEGKESGIGFLMGAVMKASNGQADPKQANELLKKLLATQ